MIESNLNLRRHSVSGFTMVELLIAMGLSLLLSVAVVTVFANNRHSFNQDENIQRMQDDARHALREITYDISMAGHYADLLAPAAVTRDNNLILTTDCGPVGEAEWMYQTVQGGTGNFLSIVALDNATAAQAAANFTCIGAAEFAPGTDVVAIKRVAGVREAAPANGNVYLRTNGTVGLLFRQPLTTVAAINVPAPNALWEYRPSIFYIRNFADTPGDGIPTLCKKVLRGPAPAMTTECIATGIEDLQVEYGIDTTGDGFANVYLPNPTVAEMQTVVVARVTLLARTVEEDNKYTNDKTYTVSNADAFSPADSFHRQVVTTTIGIQNIRSLNAMGL